MSTVTVQPQILSDPPEFGFIQPVPSLRPDFENDGGRFWPRIPEFEVVDPDRAGMLMRARELERKRNGSTRLAKLSAQILAGARKQITRFREEQVLRQRKQTAIHIKQESSETEGKSSPTESALNVAHADSGLRKLWQSVERLVQTHQARKRLRLCETISLGEKRFIAVVQVDGKQLLVGGATNGLSVLANLESSSTFSNILQRHLEEGTRA